MGQCGCGDFQPVAKMPANGGLYALEVYEGCDDCRTGAAIRLTYFPTKDVLEDNWRLREVPSIQWDTNETWVPILDRKTLQEAATAISEDAKDHLEEDDYDSPLDWFRDFGWSIVREAVRRTQEAAEPATPEADDEQD